MFASTVPDSEIRRDIFVMNPDGSDEQRITTCPEQDFFIAWGGE